MPFSSFTPSLKRPLGSLPTGYRGLWLSSPVFSVFRPIPLRHPNPWSESAVKNIPASFPFFSAPRFFCVCSFATAFQKRLGFSRTLQRLPAIFSLICVFLPYSPGCGRFPGSSFLVTLTFFSFPGPFFAPSFACHTAPCSLFFFTVCCCLSLREKSPPLILRSFIKSGEDDNSPPIKTFGAPFFFWNRMPTLASSFALCPSLRL